MDIVKFAVDNPVKIAVGVILMMLFGLVSIFEVPIQLTPTVERPVITVTTLWPGASPQEIETEIVDRQEDKLKSVSNLEKMTSTATEGQAFIRLDFPVGVDKDIAYRDVSDKLRQVPEYPEEVDEPIISATDNDMEDIIAWMILSGEGDIAHLKTSIEEQVKPILERAEGIAEVPVYGGLDREIQIEMDALGLAARGLTYRDVERALRRQNDNISAGTILQGKLEYSYRTMGEYSKLSDIENTVVAYQPGGPVLVKDVASVIDGFKKPYAFVRSQGKSVIAMPARKETGANVVTAITNLNEKVALVNRDILGPKGMKLALTQVYDETQYIWSAIYLVLNNIWAGGLLTVIVLWLFLRDFGATATIAVAIPICTIGSFLVVALLGRTLNVIMLAGMAFAVGMVVDNANVVLENIDRHRSLGKGRLQATLDGTREVWGAVLAGSLTTMVVFLPVIFIAEEVGQLFKDIAIAIASTVAISLLVAVLVMPPLAARFLSESKSYQAGGEETWRFGAWIARQVDKLTRRIGRRVALIASFLLLSAVGSWWLMPPADYLPAGNQNLVMGFLVSPPGYSVEEFRRMGQFVEDGDPANPTDGIRPGWEAELGSPEAAQLPPVTMAVGGRNQKEVTLTPPPIEDFFFVAWGGRAFMGSTSKDPDRVTPLVPYMNRALAGLPGVFGFFFQSSLFNMGSSGNSLEVEIRGEHFDDVVRSASAIQGALMQSGYGYANPDPQNFALGRPEVQLVPDREKAAHLGLDVRDLGFVIEACIDGAFVGEFNDRGDRVDMVLTTRGTKGATVESIGQIPIATPSGHVVPISTVMDLKRTAAPQQINHIEEMPSVRLDVRPKPGMPLQAVVEEIENDVIGSLRTQGVVPPTVITSTAGTASKLRQTLHAMMGNYQGTASVPNLAGLGVGRSLLLLLGVVVAIAALAGWVRGRRWAVWALLAGVTTLALAFLALNIQFTLTLLQSRMFLAVLVTYLLMAALFESFVYPLVIMVSVPFGVVGGFAALAIIHVTSLWDVYAPDQQFDTLTMLGFVMLLGIVVNNAILLVHQALNFQREGMSAHDAIVHSVRTRTRPIFMTTATTLFGLVPLVLMTGAGSELYRGLGAVLLGGLTVSTLFTLVVVPATFTLVQDFLVWLRAPRALQQAAMVGFAPTLPVGKAEAHGVANVTMLTPMPQPLEPSARSVQAERR